MAPEVSDGNQGDDGERSANRKAGVRAPRGARATGDRFIGVDRHKTQRIRREGRDAKGYADVAALSGQMGDALRRQQTSSIAAVYGPVPARISGQVPFFGGQGPARVLT